MVSGVGVVVYDAVFPCSRSELFLKESGTGAVFGRFGGRHLCFRSARRSPRRPTSQRPMQRPVEYIRVFADADGESLHALRNSVSRADCACLSRVATEESLPS